MQKGPPLINTLNTHSCVISPND